MASRAGSRRRGGEQAAPPYEFVLGRERCRERFVCVRRPMFERLVLRGDVVVALPRRGTKTASAVAFELADGRELELEALAAGAPGGGDRVRLDYLSSPVGRGPSQLWLRTGSASEPLRTIELPDAISAVCEAPFGWYVGCRDGFLYALDRSGELHWRWRTPGPSFRSAGPGERSFRPWPYRLAANGRSALVGWLNSSLWSVSPDGKSRTSRHAPTALRTLSNVRRLSRDMRVI